MQLLILNENTPKTTPVAPRKANPFTFFRTGFFVFILVELFDIQLCREQ